MRFKVTITGSYSEDERKQILERVDQMLDNHPSCLRNESVAFRFNKARVFLSPQFRTITKKDNSNATADSTGSVLAYFQTVVEKRSHGSESG